MALTNGMRPCRMVRTLSGQWRAMRDGNAGSYGNGGNVVCVSYRIQRS